MKKLYVFSVSPWSTGGLIRKMKKYAQEIGYEIDIVGYSLQQIDKGYKADYILLGPEVHYQLDSIKAQFPNKIVEAIDNKVYGRMDGKALVDMVKETLEKEVIKEDADADLDE